jgi:hypothetical protein
VFAIVNRNIQQVQIAIATTGIQLSESKSMIDNKSMITAIVVMDFNTIFFVDL